MTRYDQLSAEFVVYHRSNPIVWRLFQEYTLGLIDRGFRHYSVNAVFEHIRWKEDLPGDDGRSTFKLNNNHRPFYAREFAIKYPQHAAFYRTRAQTSKTARAMTAPPLGPSDFPYTMKWGG